MEIAVKKLLYVTGSRAEYGIMKRLLLSLNQLDNVELTLVATGMHLDERYGNTYQVIEQDGFKLGACFDMQIDNTNNATILDSMSRCQSWFGHYFQDHQFDAVMILGDRYEIFSVAIAAAMHNLPIIHLHGGEKTLGNYDEFIRHNITKMSRLHLTSTEEYRQRVIQLGEDPKTVINTGALGAENAILMPQPTKVELAEKFAHLDRPYFMVAFHPETLTNASVEAQTDELLTALSAFSKDYQFIFIGSNSDTGADKITEKVLEFCQKSGSQRFTSVQPQEYLALIKYSCGLIGNSSSGLIEVPSLKVATINIGDRQKGRVRGESVIDCVCQHDKIIQAIKQSQTAEFQQMLTQQINPYYQHNVLESCQTEIVKFLENFDANQVKDFYDLSSGN